MTFVVLALVVFILIAVGIGAYFLFAPGPRRWRSHHRIGKLLDAGKWDEALTLAEAGVRQVGSHPHWEARFKNLAGEAHQQALDHALKQKDYDVALGHALSAAAHLELDEKEQTTRVVESMLGEIRRLFAAGPAQTEALQAMVARTKKVAGDTPPEALFWLAMCHARDGNLDDAFAAMSLVHEQAGKQHLDSALYLGMLVHRLGRPQEALRYLSDANRIDPNCPFVTWQMGVSLVASNGDSGLAMRALQRALGNRGLGLWEKQPQRAWVEAFPEGKSWVRRLANKYDYTCPILGKDLTLVMRQGNLALAQAFYRQEKFQEAGDLYAKLMQDGAPTPMLSRGYGLSLARQGQFDQAYKHLRLALEQEDPKDPFTGSYLALCGAMGKPTNAEDKPKNLSWALKLLARFPMMGNAEWATIITNVHAEARKHNHVLGAEEQLLLCDALASVQATDAKAAAAYSHLANSFPDSVHPIHAWLYCRAATVNNITGPRDLDLFGRTFKSATQAKAFYTQQQWDFAEAEYTFLERTANNAPGQFPAVLGADYPAKGEAFLLERSKVHEEAGKKDPARVAVEVLLKLAPRSLAAHDRLACLHYRQGNMDGAVVTLSEWAKLAPRDHWPLVRQAVIEQERGQAERREEAINQALGLTRGPLRAAVAYLGAKLALREGAKVAKTEGMQPAALDATRRLLEECLREQPDHIEALWCLAAVRSAQGDSESLATQAPLMDQPTVPDARFHFMGAICNLAARNFKKVVELAALAAKDKTLEIESRFVLAWGLLNLNETEGAIQSLKKVAADTSSPSAACARGLLGQLSLQRGNYDDAVTWWNQVEAAARARWQIDEPLRQTVLLSGLLALKEERFEQAADRFKEAGKLGLREKRLGGMITLALVKAGQRLLYSS